MRQLDRIVRTPDVIAGKARIRGQRISVAQIVSQLAAGATIEDLLREFPALEREDVLQSLQYAYSTLIEQERQSLLATA